MSIIGFLALGGVAGWLAGMIMRGHAYGLLGNILLGMIGAVVGGYLFQAFGWGVQGAWGSFGTALVGSVALLLVASLFMADEEGEDRQRGSGAHHVVR